ncbi:hypothetical protein DA075_10360 [Methylobacterium currus]|uniref:Uncharacterized protein n=1 Tax=Methylobacterium currus TaxID=2051553 RepID=A0A2R4WI92_9HYPH|nr:hypothetical protein [Methylobacterium currus]AWB21264.1 hypothetical protein DA075_10360 [Methylobacterium currus]
MSDGPIIWRHTWPERGPDFVAILAGGQLGRIYKTHPDGLGRREWVWSLTYPAATRLTKAGRAASKAEAVEAVRAGLDEALRWHAERDQPLLLWRDEKGPDPMTDWLRGPLRLVIGQDVPWPEGWGQTQKCPQQGDPGGLK